MRSKLLMVLLFGLVLPVALMAWMRRQSQSPPNLTQPTAPEQTLSVLTDSGTVTMTWTDYLTGVVLGEMPADFHPEALKAQAVVARTYAGKRLASDKHSGAVCTQPSCCQGYTAPESYLQSGGRQAAVDKVAAAVEGAGEWVLTYEGALIDATYFSCSGGTTEAAVEVWGSDVPYLQAVESPGEEQAEHYSDAVSFTPAQLAAALGLSPVGDASGWFGKVTYTQGGGVDTMVICGQTFTGKQLRSLLGLRSTVFTVGIGDDIVFETRGYGHRVGMSQYGANAMAQSGASWQEILAHYYPGTAPEQAEQNGTLQP